MDAGKEKVSFLQGCVPLASEWMHSQDYRSITVSYRIHYRTLYPTVGYKKKKWKGEGRWVGTEEELDIESEKCDQNLYHVCRKL